MLSTDSTQNTTLYTRQSPGLPNIEGRFAIYVRPEDPDNKLFTLSGTGGNATYTGPYGQRYVNFNASGYNSIYGASDEVRPINYAVNYFIKY